MKTTPRWSGASWAIAQDIVSTECKLLGPHPILTTDAAQTPTGRTLSRLAMGVKFFVTFRYTQGGLALADRTATLAGPIEAAH